MKKRLICMIFCLVMALSALAGCSSSGSSSIVLVDTPMTLTIYAITDEKTTEAGIQQAQDAINAITEYDFATHIVLKLFTADEYVDKLQDDLVIARRRFDASDVPAVTEKAETAPADTGESEGDEDGEITTEERVYVERDAVVYPEAEDGQVDILLINSIDLFNDLVNNDDIQPLDVELADSAKLISKFVNPIMLNACKGPSGQIYAVPNNRAVGQYEYLLLRRDLMDSYYYDKDDIHSLLQLQEYIEDVQKINPEVTPLLDTYGVTPLAVSMVEGEDSLYGAYVGYNAQANTNAMPRVLTTVSRYRNELSFLYGLKKSGALVSGEMPEDPDAAAIFVKGDSTIPEKYADKYYVNVYRYPTMTSENVFNSLYAVSTYSKSLRRSMAIINYLMTNYDLRNAFQYGDRDTNYTIDKNDFVTILNDEYVMDPIYTGNMFLLYQNDRMTEEELAFSADNWKLAKEQMVDAVASSYFGFSGATTEVNYPDPSGMSRSEIPAPKMMEEIAKLSREYMNKINSFTGTTDEFVEFLKQIGDEMSKDQYVKAASNSRYTNAPYAKYVEWYKQRFSES
ncbi:MAG: hypothetical protein IJR90_06380 [Clostridia bacterium]|nr:hypothetical protein [Clostridia bacterium]